MEIVIGVYTENKELIGYKADSWWNLSKSYAKPDKLVAGTIRQSLIDNLKHILSKKGLVAIDKYVVGTLAELSRQHNYSNFETRLIGYAESPDGQPVFTHRILENDVQPLDAEDTTRLNQTE